MRISIVGIILAAAFAVASTPAAASSSHSESCGQSVITVGDPATKVQRACGAPWRTVQLVNSLGAGIGERWEYERTTGMLLITISGGRVTRIERV